MQQTQTAADTARELAALGGMAEVEGIPGHYTRAEPAPPEADPHYSLMADGDPHPLQTWPRDQEGLTVVYAIDLAARLSLRGGPHSVYIEDRLLARFVGGAREGRTRPLRAPVRVSD